MLNSEPIIKELLEDIGEDVDREGLVDTPRRVAKYWKEVTTGYSQNVEDVLTAFDSEGYNQMILLKDIEFYSNCEHHMVPFFGRAHVAYIPGDRIVGISKLARIVDIFSKRLQNQERLTQQIADAIQNALMPKGVAVVLEGQHMCMLSRGVNKQNSIMKTSKLTGAFMNEGPARQEFFNLISK